MKIKVSKEAARELEEAAAWYEKEQAGLGTRLIDAFEHAIQLLKEPNPPLTPVQGEAARLGGKKLILHRFPFSLINCSIQPNNQCRRVCSSFQKTGLLEETYQPIT